MKKKKIVYAGFAADILHEGHINILKSASKLGKVIVGLLTDEAITSYKKLPHLNYKQREIIIKNIKFVDSVIPQKTLDYQKNLLRLKPDFVVHGDDWKIGVQKETRQQVIDVLNEWGGKLVEPEYTKGVSSTQLINTLKERGITPNKRLKSLRRLINTKPTLAPKPL